MRKKIIRNALLIGLVTGVAAQSGLAEGLLGKRYAEFEIGLMRPGKSSVRDIDSSVLLLGAGVNVPVDPNIDAKFDVSYAELDGRAGGVKFKSQATALQAGLAYHFMPNEEVNPFVGVSAGFVYSEAKVSGFGAREKDDDTDFLLNVGAGVEFDVHEQVAIRPEVAYIKVGSDDDFVAGVSANYWINEAMFAGLGTSYAFDDGDITWSVGFGIGF